MPYKSRGTMTCARARWSRMCPNIWSQGINKNMRHTKCICLQPTLNSLRFGMAWSGSMFSPSVLDLVTSGVSTSVRGVTQLSLRMLALDSSHLGSFILPQASLCVGSHSFASGITCMTFVVPALDHALRGKSWKPEFPTHV